MGRGAKSAGRESRMQELSQLLRQLGSPSHAHARLLLPDSLVIKHFWIETVLGIFHAFVLSPCLDSISCGYGPFISLFLSCLTGYRELGSYTERSQTLALTLYL